MLQVYLGKVFRRSKNRQKRQNITCCLCYLNNIHIYTVVNKLLCRALILIDLLARLVIMDR